MWIAAEMNKNVLITEGVVGDIKVILEKINATLEQQSHPEWMKKIMDYKEKYPLTYHPEASYRSVHCRRDLPPDKW